jgi:hypothetical protein
MGYPPLTRYTVTIPETLECSGIEVKVYQSGDIALRQGEDLVYLDGDQVRAFFAAIQQSAEGGQ